MKLLIALCLVATTLAYEEALSIILKSPTATLQLYGDFKAKQHLKYDPAEDRLRFRLFRKNAELVAASNSVFEDTADYALNFFSSMTEEEKQQWRGLNATGHLPNDDVPVKLNSQLQAPSSQLWVNKGAVTVVKNQGSCGSCWSFAAVGGLETRYQQQSGVLRNFAEQEYLDCVYEGVKNGCNGGWPDKAYSHSASKGGRHASTKDYPYTAKDSTCKDSSKPNAAIAYKITGSVRVGSSESANIEALATGSLSMAFEVTNKFHQYRGGILRDTTCTGRINHGVTGVGYTANYVLVKNSWGTSWGDNGYVKFARNHGNCELFKYSSYAKLTSTGQKDNGGNDKATDYSPDDDDDTPDPQPDPDCKDVAINCTKDLCKNAYIAEKYCQKTCDKCTEADCPSGTIKCPDGVCRHEHMC